MGPTVYRWLCTISVFLLWLNIGIANSIEGPTLVDLTMLYNTTYGTISSAVAVRGLGVVFGAIVTGFFVDMSKNAKMWILELAQTIFVICLVVIPFARVSWALGILFTSLGVSNGATQVAVIALLLELWKRRSAEVISLCLLSVTVGDSLTPVIVNPFLAELNFTKPEQEHSCSLKTNLDNGNFTVVHPTNVTYGYLCAGIVVLLLSIPFIVAHVLHYKTPPDFTVIDHEDRSNMSLKEMLNPATYANGSVLYGSFIIWIVSLYTFNCYGIYFISATFIRTFAIGVGHLGRDNASVVVILMHFGSILGCMMASLMARKISIQRLFITFNILSFVSAMVMRFRPMTAVWLYVAGTMVGFCSFPLTGQYIPMSDSQIETKGVVLGLLITVRGLSELYYVWSLGHQIDTYGPKIFNDLLFFVSFATFLYSVLFSWVAYKHGDRREVH